MRQYSGFMKIAASAVASWGIEMNTLLLAILIIVGFAAVIADIREINESDYGD